jgi:hypothetical protein
VRATDAIVVDQQPTATEADHVISPAVTVELLDRFNNLTTSSTSLLTPAPGSVGRRSV